MPAQNLHKPRLFVDANIFVAAALSSSGGSFRLLQESHHDNINLLTNQYARDEAQFLVTLDRRDFMSETLYRIESPFHIVTPGDFFQKYYSSNRY